MMTVFVSFMLDWIEKRYSTTIYYIKKGQIIIPWIEQNTNFFTFDIKSFMR